MAVALRVHLLTTATLLGALVLGFSFTSVAQTPVPDVIIDDFEDGDTSDWGFFGGNNAGGGGAPLGDRPQEGSFYFSTGWGGEGSASGFYGGAFKNFDNAAQPTPPADPWFNVWVLNQSDATVDGYTLEITLREDGNGDGWTNGLEDSIRLDASFVSSEFNDEWVLVSAPLSSFIDLGTGGNGVFDGTLDEVVIVIAGVTGGNPSTVEVDFDQFSFTSGGPLVADDDDVLVFDDMEHGDPSNNGWFSFGGGVGGGGIGPNNTDLPSENGGAFSLETGWGSGGVAGFLGGFGRTKPLDVDGPTHFNFWINPNASQEYTLEINLQDDDNGDGATNPADDDEFQYNCVVSASGPCAVSGGGWQLVSIPLADFFDDNSFFTGGNGVLDPVSVTNGGNGQLINVVWAVIGTGTDVNFRTDYWVFSSGSLVEPIQVVDDFEDGLPEGVDVDGNSIGFYTFSDGSFISIATTNTPPAPRPDAPGGNNVLDMTGDVTGFAGFIHGFENGELDTWVTGDWSTFAGFRLWFYGQNTGTAMFIDVLDNRNPGSTRDDAERYSVSFFDDFSGWQLLEFPFDQFARKEIGNGAPNDGFGRLEVHGWALGALSTGGRQVTWYVDQVEVYGAAEIPELTVNFSQGGYGFEEGTIGDITVKLNRAINSDDPGQVSVDYATSPGTAAPGRDYIPTSGTLTFVNGGPRELSFPVETIDDSKWQGGRSFLVTLSNPVDVATAPQTVVSAFVVDNDEFDPLLQDDFEGDPYLWEAGDNVALSYLELAADAPWALPGQDAFEGVLQVDSPLGVDAVVQNQLCNNPNGKKKLGKQAVVNILTTDTFDALSIDHKTVTLGDASERHVDKKTGLPRRHEEDVDNDGDTDLVFHFERSEIGDYCDTGEPQLIGQTFSGEAVTGTDSAVTFSRDFPIGTDWSEGEALSFWYYGSGSGAEVKVTLKDNRAPDPGPSGWSLAWADEFNEPAGTPPKPENWSYEIGDGTINGIPGWGNEELQYYTDDPENAATDGTGNMVITLREAGGSLSCYYGPCEYTSARLISQHKAEFAYGRIESRIRVPDGEAGLWPAFWSLGTDIGLVGWPQTGEIDFMEYVSRLPNEIFGTIHGPGYSGGQSFAGILDFGEPTYSDYRTFTVEWEPDLIRWYVDGVMYHEAQPGSVAPNPWVFNDPVFLLLNMAVGGNFGGDVDPDLQTPQELAVDYVRVFQAPDTAERFETSFVDDFEGWHKVELPFTAFVRSAEQPAGAPDDGLTLSDVWGYGFELTEGGSALLDEVRVELPPPLLSITVTDLSDSGEGSLRAAMATIGSGGVISFDPALTGGVIGLASGQLVASKDMTIDASAAPGLVVSGGNASRVLQVDGGVTISMNDIAIADGAGAPQGGGILNLGTLNLDRVVVMDNVETSLGANFAFGGGGIYNGDGATLNLTDSTVTNNATVEQPGGGVYGFFNSTVNITRSTIDGNVGGDVAGGLRTLGNLTVVNSTISNNVSSVWHGGAAFITDGTATIVNSTITDNLAPGGTAGGLMVATFGAPVTVTVTNSIVANNGDYDCQIEGGGAAVLNSGGNNVFRDGSCSPVGSDIQADPLVGPLQNNGGPTRTRALLLGSPAIDAASNADCPATDQRGITRDAACDVGAFELE